jgi:hypothetical protein
MRSENVPIKALIEKEKADGNDYAGLCKQLNQPRRRIRR